MVKVCHHGVRIMYRLLIALYFHRNHFGKFSCPVVFCHNDMQEGNILLKNNVFPSETSDVSDSQYEQLDASSLIIIDYEYCAYNYRSYEIANHFIEWIFDYKVDDYPYFSIQPEQYPTLEQQVRSDSRFGSDNFQPCQTSP